MAEGFLQGFQWDLGWGPAPPGLAGTLSKSRAGDGYGPGSRPGREMGLIGINGLLGLPLWETLISMAYKHRRGRSEVRL